MSLKKTTTVQFESFIFKLEHLVGMHCIEVSKEIVKKLGGGFSLRLICTVNNFKNAKTGILEKKEISFQGGLVALGEGKAYISINQKRLKELSLGAGDRAMIKLEIDQSKFGMDLPIELEELFKQDTEGERRFNLLTPGKQRYIIHYVSSVKNVQLRINRALLLIGNLKKLQPGKEDFRAMLGK